MKIQQTYINRCIALSKNGLAAAMPNPSVGAVLVHNNRIIGEGYTSAYGGAHAEVHAIAFAKAHTQRNNNTNKVLPPSLGPAHNVKLLLNKGFKRILFFKIYSFKR